MEAELKPIFHQVENLKLDDQNEKDERIRQSEEISRLNEQIKHLNLLLNS